MKNLVLVLGFLLMFLGLLSIILSMIGLQFSFLTWLDQGSRLTGFIVRLVMFVGGIVLIYLASQNWKEEQV